MCMRSSSGESFLAGISGSEAGTGPIVGNHLARMNVVGQHITPVWLPPLVDETWTLRDCQWRISTELAKLRGGRKQRAGWTVKVGLPRSVGQQW